jgi:hypothetical protein
MRRTWGPVICLGGILDPQSALNIEQNLRTRRFPLARRYHRYAVLQDNRQWRFIVPAREAGLDEHRVVVGNGFTGKAY